MGVPVRVLLPPQELDLITVAAFRRTLADACKSGHDGVIVDFTCVSFCGLAGVQALAVAATAMAVEGRTFAIWAPPKSLLLAARAAGLTQVLGLAEPAPQQSC